MIAKNNKISAIERITVVMSLFPYNGLFFLFPTDIQPFTIISIAPYHGKLSILSLSSFALFATCCLSLLRVNYSTEIFSTFRSVVGYFSAFIIFNYWASAKESQILFLSEVVKIAIFIYFGSAIFNLMFIFAGQEEIFQSVVSLFKSRAAVAAGGRGVTGIVPEPSFLSLTIYLLLLISFLVNWDNKLSVRKITQELLPVIITIILTYSGTNLFLCASILVSSIISLKNEFIVFLLKFKKTMLYSVTFLILFCIVKIFTSTDIQDSESTRFEIILSNFSQNGFSSLLNDASIFDRFWSVYSPFASLSKNIFGYGTSGFTSFMSLYDLREDLIYNTGISNNIDLNYDGKLMNLFGNYLIDFGWLGAALIGCFLISINIQVRKKSCYLAKHSVQKKYFVFTSVVLICLQAIPVSHPLPWLLFGLLVNPLILK
jgi:hypothetical protein